MKRRIIAAVAAVLLAAVGAVGIFAYVSRADQRAMAGQQTAEVLVITKPVPKGATPAEMTKSVTSKLLPQTAIVPGAVDSLTKIGDGLVTTADLQPGEQVLGSRFADPATLINANSAPVPKGLQELSLQLDSQRVLGANLVPGDTVGVFLTIGVKPDRKTHLVAAKVLVSRVQGGLAPAPATDKSTAQAAPLPDTTSVMVTLAVTAPQAEKIVHAAEDGNVWLSHETADDNETGTTTINDGNVLQ
jgi:pilus assembly protein CpaB